MGGLPFELHYHDCDVFVRTFVSGVLFLRVRPTVLFFSVAEVFGLLGVFWIGFHTEL